MCAIAAEAADNPERIKAAPTSRPVRRLDEVRATRHPVVRFRFEEHEHPAGAGSRQLEAQKGA